MVQKDKQNQINSNKEYYLDQMGFRQNVYVVWISWTKAGLTGPLNFVTFIQIRQVPWIIIFLNRISYLLGQSDHKILGREHKHICCKLEHWLIHSTHCNIGSSEKLKNALTNQHNSYNTFKQQKKTCLFLCYIRLFKQTSYEEYNLNLKVLQSMLEMSLHKKYHRKLSKITQSILKSTQTRPIQFFKIKLCFISIHHY